MSTPATHNTAATTKPERNTRHFRLAFLAPFLYGWGYVCWLVGAALLVAVQPRTGIFIDNSNGKWLGAGILFIIASAFWVLASLVGLLAAYAEAAILAVGGRTPGLALVLIWASWLEFIGSILLLIGSAIWVAGTGSTTSTGSILWLIGASIFLLGDLLFTAISLIIGSVTLVMPMMMHRQRAWFAIAAQIMFAAGMLLFTIGAMAFVVQFAPGFYLFGALLWLIAASIWVVSGFVRMWGSWFFFVPILAFATATAALSTLPVAAGAAAVGAGVVGATAGKSHTESAPVNGATAPNAPGSTVASTTSATHHASAAPENVQVAV